MWGRLREIEHYLMRSLLILAIAYVLLLLFPLPVIVYEVTIASLLISLGTFYIISRISGGLLGVQKIIAITYGLFCILFVVKILIIELF